jgi:hypothetical protein
MAVTNEINIQTVIYLLPPHRRRYHLQKTTRLMLFKVIIAVYYENPKNHVGNSADVFNIVIINQDGAYA